MYLDNSFESIKKFDPEMAALCQFTLEGGLIAVANIDRLPAGNQTINHSVQVSTTTDFTFILTISLGDGTVRREASTPVRVTVLGTAEPTPAPTLPPEEGLLPVPSATTAPSPSKGGNSMLSNIIIVLIVLVLIVIIALIAIYFIVEQERKRKRRQRRRANTAAARNYAAQSSRSAQSTAWKSAGAGWVAGQTVDTSKAGDRTDRYDWNDKL